MGRGLTKIRVEFREKEIRVRGLSQSRRGSLFTVSSAVRDVEGLGKSDRRRAIEELISELYKPRVVTPT